MKDLVEGERIMERAGLLRRPMKRRRTVVNPTQEAEGESCPASRGAETQEMASFDQTCDRAKRGAKAGDGAGNMGGTR